MRAGRLGGAVLYRYEPLQDQLTLAGQLFDSTYPAFGSGFCPGERFHQVRDVERSLERSAKFAASSVKPPDAGPQAPSFFGESPSEYRSVLALTIGERSDEDGKTFHQLALRRRPLLSAESGSHRIEIRLKIVDAIDDAVRDRFVAGVDAVVKQVEGIVVQLQGLRPVQAILVRFGRNRELLSVCQAVIHFFFPCSWRDRRGQCHHGLTA